MAALLIALSAAWVAFAYLGYPVLLALLARVAPRPPLRREPIAPPISIIIAARNAGRTLASKLEATLALRYPGEREILVASDASEDDTDAIAAGFAARGVRLVRREPRGGKEAAQAAAIAVARGEVLVFTDVGAEVEPDALPALLAPFADPTVGCVSSEDLVSADEGEGAYAAYEMALRRLETRSTGLVGLSGSLFAARRSLCDPWPVDLASDFRTALEAASRGLLAVAEPGARARIQPLSDPRREWERKVRTVRRGIAVLARYTHLLSPRAGRVAFALWGHKVARFGSPIALVVLVAASAAAAAGGSRLGQALLALELAGLGLGAAALVHAPLRRFALPRLAAFFLLVNASMLVAWGHHLAGQRAVTWTPTAR